MRTLKLFLASLIGSGLATAAAADLTLAPELATNPPGEDHTVTATATDGGGAIEGTDVTFQVVAGPNVGAMALVATDANGEADFTYTGNGGTGVDEIFATFTDATGASFDATALKFWDEDCNENGIADSCDVECGGFAGACSAFADCGLLDENGDLFPDDCNRPPDCTAATVTPAQLWPPNHWPRMVAIEGVTDPDGDTPTVLITSIFQDEPLRSPGSGNTCPDALAVGTLGAVMRAEREARTQNGQRVRRGDGRVYHLTFSAEDGRGGTCEGTVQVCVPHDRRRGGVCVDQGPRFDSADCEE